MKKTRFLILFVLIFSGCTKTIEIQEVKVNTGLSTPSIEKTGHKIISNSQKTNETKKETLKDKSIETGLSIYENKKGSFSLTFSPNRGFQENIGSSLVTFSRGGLSGSDQASISFSQLELADIDATISLETYYDQNKLSIRDAISDFTEISQKKSKIDGSTALEVVYKGQKNSQEFQIKQIFFQKSNTMFIVTYLSSKSIFSKYLPEVDRIVSSIKIK